MEKIELATGIASRLSGLQKRSGMSVEAFGAQHGAKRSAQFMYQRGESVPELQYLLSVAESCGVTLQWLVFGDAVADGGELTDDERTIVERFRALPPKIRDVMESVLLLAYLAADSRRNYHHTAEPEPTSGAPGSYEPGEPAPPQVLHDAPRRIKAKPVN